MQMVQAILILSQLIVHTHSPVMAFIASPHTTYRQAGGSETISLSLPPGTIALPIYSPLNSLIAQFLA